MANPTQLNWQLVGSASAITVLILAGLGVTTYAVLESSASETPPDSKLPALASKAAPVPIMRNHAVISKSDDPQRGPSATFEDPAPAGPTIPLQAAPAAPAQPITWAPLDEHPEAAPACETYGTSVNFLSSTAAAAALAAREQKLQLVLHISGNFEDSRFT